MEIIYLLCIPLIPSLIVLAYAFISDSKDAKTD
jgi:hypothetical protein